MSGFQQDETATLNVMHMPPEEGKPNYLSFRLDGGGTGCCLGSFSATFLFIAFLFLLYYFSGDFDAEGVPGFTLLSMPIGAIGGTILWPILFPIGRHIIRAIKNK